VFSEGTRCQDFLFLTDGVVRVQRPTASGREIILYHVGPGQTCILTTTCLLGHADYPAQGVVERDARAVRMPVATFRELMAESDPFRRFVFAQIGARIALLMERVQTLAFDRTRTRLARLLLERCAGKAGTTITTTHQEVASELGTAREVVSRLLKDFERHGWVGLARGRVTVRDTDALRAEIDPL